MSDTPKQPKIKRRQFLAGAAAAAPAVGLATALSPRSAKAQTARSVPARPIGGGDANAPGNKPPLGDKMVCGADHMVDCLKGLGFDYIASCPGSTFRALQESLINYGGNNKPEFITAVHEDSSVHYCQGYAKAAGKPMAALVHGVVGLQHATMAVYNAFGDEVPVYIIAGNMASEWTRRPGAESAHSAHDQADIVRDFIKWDQQPVELRDFSRAAARCYQEAVSDAPGPTLLVADADLQEEPVHADDMAQLQVIKVGKRAGSMADTAAVKDIATMLCNATYPVISVDRYGNNAEAVPLLVELAEALQAPVIDTRGRMNFPNHHPLNHTEIAGPTLRRADVVLALEPRDLFAMIYSLQDLEERNAVLRIPQNCKVIRLGVSGLGHKPNFGVAQRFVAADLEIEAEAQPTLPALIDEVKRQAKPSFAARGQKLRQATAGLKERMRQAAVYGWNASPISTARLSAEVWNQIKDEDYTLATAVQFLSNWPHRMWTMDKHYNHLGGSGSWGVGYNSPAAVGAALANRDQGRLTIGMVGDGDFMMQPGVMWTAAHHKIPILMIVHNNRAYHQELMHVERMAARHNRGITRAHIGTTIEGPNIDYAAMIKSMGVYTEGPVDNPNDIGPAIRRALAVVKRGEPALIDVVSQPR